MTSNPPSEAWSRARRQIEMLERSAERLSPQWVFGNLGVIAAAALFLVTAIVIGGAVARMLDNAAHADHAQEIQQMAGDLQDSATESAALARAYALQREPELAAARFETNRRLNAILARLGGLVQKDEDGLRHFLSIKEHLKQRIASYDAFLNEKSHLAISAGEVQRLTLARLSNADIAKLRQMASRRFQFHQGLVIADMRLAMTLAVITGLASPLFGLIGIHLLRRERESQRARELQFELMHVQRLAIMGETSAMLAHEINQPLTAAANYLAVMRRQLDGDSDTGANDKAKAMSERVEQQIHRAASILKKLRRFIEKRESEMTMESPDVLVDDAITLLGTIDSTVSLRTQAGDDLPLVLVDRVQLQQVLVNLMRNAIEAMQNSETRELLLTVTAKDRKTVEIALADRGPGLAPDVAARLFQPFVSTKPNGMGVGLSICHSIISQHHGRIWAEPNPDGGTIFRFVLPAAEQRAVA